MRSAMFDTVGSPHKQFTTMMTLVDLHDSCQVLCRFHVMTIMIPELDHRLELKTTELALVVLDIVVYVQVIPKQILLLESQVTDFTFELAVFTVQGHVSGVRFEAGVRWTVTMGTDEYFLFKESKLLCLGNRTALLTILLQILVRKLFCAPMKVLVAMFTLKEELLSLRFLPARFIAASAPSLPSCFVETQLLLNVRLHQILLFELFVTEEASVNRSRVRMCQHMSLAVIFPVEGFGTQRALVHSLVSMRLGVIDEMTLLSERFVADFTRIISLVVMDGHVSL